ncbi:uncharacterized protein LOC144444180 [Glandiceps talaboti]
MTFLTPKLMFATLVLVLWCVLDTEAGECCGTPGISFPGNDIPSSTGDLELGTLEDSQDACCARCKETADCVVWVYHVERTECYLKHTLGEKKIWPEDHEVYAGLV